MDEHLEFHDARVSRIEITVGSHLLVEFEHIALYKRETQTTFGMWSCRARLRAEGVQHLSYEGRLSFQEKAYGESDWIADGRICDAHGEVVPTVEALRSVLHGKLELEWTASASRLVCAATRIMLEIAEVGERFDSFEDDDDEYGTRG